MATREVLVRPWEGGMGGGKKAVGVGGVRGGGGAKENSGSWGGAGRKKTEAHIES